MFGWLNSFPSRSQLIATTEQLCWKQFSKRIYFVLMIKRCVLPLTNGKKKKNLNLLNAFTFQWFGSVRFHPLRGKREKGIRKRTDFYQGALAYARSNGNLKNPAVRGSKWGSESQGLPSTLSLTTSVSVNIPQSFSKCFFIKWEGLIISQDHF